LDADTADLIGVPPLQQKNQIHQSKHSLQKACSKYFSVQLYAHVGIAVSEKGTKINSQHCFYVHNLSPTTNTIHHQCFYTTSISP